MTGSVTLKVDREDFPGVAFGDIVFKPARQEVTQATVRSSQVDGAVLTVNFVGVESEATALELSREVADEVSNILTYQTRKYFPTFQITEHALVDDQPNPVHRFGSHLGLVCSAEYVLSLSPDQTAAVRNLLEQTDEPRQPYYEQLRSALSMTDVLSRFMGMYSILLSLCRDRQDEVDRFVLRIQKSIPTNPPHRERSDGTPETIYTRLRNEIGHVRKGATLQGTRTEMETYLDDLIQVTQAKIAQLP